MESHFAKTEINEGRKGGTDSKECEEEYMRGVGVRERENKKQTFVNTQPNSLFACYIHIFIVRNPPLRTYPLGFHTNMATFSSYII
jgi:hypothetical protein